MGVYVFRSFHAPYIKVGHYSGKNAFSRIAHRGFGSCVCPNEIKGRVAMDDVELMAWFPRQTTKTEQQIKKKWKHSRIYGKSEWFPLDKMNEIIEYLEKLEPNQAHVCDPFQAVLVRRRL
jgi:hypothetical protein